MATDHMRRFWDARARENVYYFINNTLDYRAPDAERFWASGEEVWELLADSLDVRLRPSDMALDVGCGMGRLTRALAARAREVIGLDVSAEMVQRARAANRDLPNVRFLEGDGATLAGISDASVDAIVSFVVFHHIPDPMITLGYVREMGRVLRPGGWAAFQVSDAPALHRVSAAPRESLRQRIRQLAGRAPSGRRDPAWCGSAVDLGALRSTADGAGLETERVTGQGTQCCLVRLRRRAQSPPAPSSR